MSRLLLPALGLALALPAAALAAGTASLPATPNEELYSRYHQAIEVAHLCRDIDFDDGDINRMSEVIAAKVQHDIGAKRLRLKSEATDVAKALVKEEGCEDAAALSLLELYDADLAAVVD